MKRMSSLLICTLLAACSTVGTPVSETSGITFVHLNDTYRVGDVEDGKAGGFSRVVTVIKELQAEGKDVRILHGGDFLYPSLESSLWQGEQMVEAFNFMDAVAPMYAVAGNHEFDPRTPGSLINAVRASQFDWLGDNYKFATGEDDVDSALKAAFTFESNGKTIGIFSLSIHPDDGGNERTYLPMQKDYAGIAEKVINEFERAGVDAIIGVTHLHMWQDTELARLRAKHPKFVFIVGGHEHESEFSPFTEQSAAVMKGASNARVIWTIDLFFDAAGAPYITTKELPLDGQVMRDPEYDALAARWRERLLETYPFLEATVGAAALPLDAREVTVRNEESNWATFIADQMRGAFGKPAADLAFINGGTLRIDDFVQDDIRFEDIGRTFGFSSFLRYTTVSGKEFRQIMEAGYRGFGPSKGYFPQVSGFRVCVDRSRNEGDRIVSLQIPGEDGWAEIVDDQEYSLVVPDFLFGGGDGYQIPKDRPASRPASELVYLVLDAILDAQSRGEKVGKPIDDSNRRYHELREGKEPCFPTADH
jgi:2',3'-cyclic-nucleotide 2'-phosphodiesterase (5'-nucleotidase family)